jgi:hypothetical protein
MSVFEIITIIVAIVFAIGWTLALFQPYFWVLPLIVISFWIGIVYFAFADPSPLHLWWYMPAAMVGWSIFGLLFRRRM